MSDRYYSFRIVTYYTDVKNLEPILNEAYKYAWILHDRDETEPHIHILCTFKQNKSFESVRKFFKPLEGQKEQNTFVQEMKDKYNDFSYLPHKEGYDKALYSPEDIHTNDLSFFTGKAVDKRIETAEFINDMVDGNLTLRELAVKYGRDFMKNYKTYYFFICDLKRQEENLHEYTTDPTQIKFDSETGELIVYCEDPDYAKKKNEQFKRVKKGV